MSQDKKLTWENLDRLWRSPDTVALPIEGNKYAIFSDMHLGNGRGADDFCKNKDAMQRALDYYKNNGYKLILLGDIEEFWQFGLREIKRQYTDAIYEKIKAFEDQNVYRIWGNHDSEWSGLDDPARKEPRRFAAAVEALKMKDKQGHQCILLLHGHQGSTESDKGAWLSRRFVRIWRYIEPAFRWLGLCRNPSATKSQIPKDYEKIFYSWAKQNKVIIICGHSHRAIFASKSYMEMIIARIAEGIKVVAGGKADLYERVRKLGTISKDTLQLVDEWLKNRSISPLEPGAKSWPCYFNTGCALYDDGITAIEIANDEIRLVEWKREVKNGKEIEEFDKGILSRYIEDVTKGS